MSAAHYLLTALTFSRELWPKYLWWHCSGIQCWLLGYKIVTLINLLTLWHCSQWQQLVSIWWSSRRPTIPFPVQHPAERLQTLQCCRAQIVYPANKEMSHPGMVRVDSAFWNSDGADVRDESSRDGYSGLSFLKLWCCWCEEHEQSLAQGPGLVPHVARVWALAAIIRDLIKIPRVSCHGQSTNQRPVLSTATNQRPMLSTAAKQRWEDVVTRRNTWVGWRAIGVSWWPW